MGDGNNHIKIFGKAYAHPRKSFVVVFFGEGRRPFIGEISVYKVLPCNANRANTRLPRP